LVWVLPQREAPSCCLPHSGVLLLLLLLGRPRFLRQLQQLGQALSTRLQGQTACVLMLMLLLPLLPVGPRSILALGTPWPGLPW
jgi:hypothetical protein